MRYISAALRVVVIERDGNRCEYCKLSQTGQAATFHIDHVVPIAADGPTDADTLALACVSCSLRKGAKQNVFDQTSGEEIPLFNPRIQLWHEHFEWNGNYVNGVTRIGQVTIQALAMNREIMLAIREEERYFDRHPPTEDDYSPT